MSDKQREAFEFIYEPEVHEVYFSDGKYHPVDAFSWFDKEEAEKANNCFNLWIAACEWQAAQQEAEPVKPMSPLEKDGIPSLYASRTGYPPCTHRISKLDIPVWCKTSDDTSDLMDILTDSSLTQPAKPAVPDEMTIERAKDFIISNNEGEYFRFTQGFNACRDAILAAAPQPDNNKP